MTSLKNHLKITAVVLIVVLAITSIALAEESEIYETFKLSFEQIRESITIGNKDILALEVAEERNKLMEEQAEDELRRKLGSDRHQYEMNYRSAQRATMNTTINRDNQIKRLQHETENLYLSYLSLDKKVDVQEENINFLREVLKLEELQYEQGNTTSNNIKQINLQIENAKLVLKNLHQEKDFVLDKIKNLTGLEASELVEFEQPKDIEYIQLDLAAAVDNATNEGAGVKAAEREYQWKAEDMEYYEKEKGISSNEYKLTQLEAEEALITLNQARNSARINVEDAYRKANTAFRVYEVSKKAVEVGEDNVRIAELRYDLGMSSGIDLTQEQLQLAEKKQAYYEAKYEYIKAINSFRLAEKGVI